VKLHPYFSVLGMLFAGVGITSVVVGMAIDSTIVVASGVCVLVIGFFLLFLRKGRT